MTRTRRFAPILLLTVVLTTLLSGAQQPVADDTAAIPRLVQFSGAIADAPLRSGIVGITFALYREEQGGAPLWMETQNVPLDASGHYTVMLGATESGGLPLELFTSREARWLGIEPQGLPAQARVLLLSVPYALKAGDAETIGGLPASAFVLAAPTTTPSVLPGAASRNSGNTAPPPNSPVTGLGTANYVPMWDGASDIINSGLFQGGTASKPKIGIGTASPSSTLDVKGPATIRGTLNLPATATATAVAGKDSDPLALAASAFNSSTSTAVKQTFQWQTEPVGNNTSAATGSLNLLFAQGSSTPAETGLNIASNGKIKFAAGQTFPGTGNGTVTGVAAGTDLTGGGSSGNLTLNVDTTKVPQLNTANTFTGNQGVNGNLTASGTVNGSVISAVTSFNLGGNAFAFGSTAIVNSFLGFAGNFTTTGSQNVGTGAGALSSNTTGSGNTASGVGALISNTTGSNNTATGWDALEVNSTGQYNTADGVAALTSSTSSYNTAIGSYSLNADTTGGGNTATGANALKSNTAGSTNTASGYYGLSDNTTGSNNTASGWEALSNNATGSNNTALGANAGPDASHPNLTNATAIGTNAQVTASNAMVLGSINGVNGATSDTLVGIGTTAPVAKLDVHGPANFTGLISFAAGQTFPGTGTITGVIAGTDLIGGGSSGNVPLNVDTTKVVTGVTAGTDMTGGGTGGVQTLNLDTTKVPQLNTANIFTGNQTVNGSLSATGAVTGSSYQIGSNLFAYGSYANENTYLGFSGGTTLGGGSNTASGFGALSHVDDGCCNTASGVAALQNDTEGNSNTAVGWEVLASNTMGVGNTAVGYASLGANDTGSYNTALGLGAGPGNADFERTFTTAIGARAEVDENNAMVLGAINGLNQATADTNVGIGTTTPQALLHIDHASLSAGQDVLMITSGGSAAVASLLLKSTASGGLQLREGVGTGTAYLSSTGALQLITKDTGTPSNPGPAAVFITATGNVGIGTTSPSNILSVLQGKGSVIADGYATYSSRRWKTNIHPLDNALGKVEQLQGVSYDLKGSGKHEIGVIAEEVGKVVPEVVSYENNGKDARGVDYSRLTALLIEATKEQQALIRKQQGQIERQQAQIKAQQTENRAEQAQLNALASQVRAIRTSLRTRGRTSSEVRTVKAELSLVHQ